MSNLKNAVKAHNNALRNLHLLMKEQKRYPPNYTLPQRPAGHRHSNSVPWMPNNYLNRYKAALIRYNRAHEALHNAIGTPKNTPLNMFMLRTIGSHRHSSTWNNGSNARLARIRNASQAVRANAATVLQKIRRGTLVRRELTAPTPRPPAYPKTRNLAIWLGLMNNNTTRGYTLTPNQLAKHIFMMNRKQRAKGL